MVDTVADTAGMKIPTTKMGTVPVKWMADRGRWMLTICANKVKRRMFFKAKEDALREWARHCRMIETHGKQSAEYDAKAHTEYAEAKRIANGADLREVARVFVEMTGDTGKKVRVEVAADEFVESRRTRKTSAAHVSALSSHLRTFGLQFGKRLCQEVKGNEILRWLLEVARERSPKTVANYRASLTGFFNWAARRGYVRVSPMDGASTEDLPVVPLCEKETFSVEQAAAVMRWFERERPEWAAAFSLQLFAGLRQAEVARMQWEWIDFDRRVVNMPGWRSGSRVVKTGDNWGLHDLPENLWAWLEKYRGNGAVAAPSAKELSAVRKAIVEELGLKAWPKNAPRHTFCSMMISLHSDAAKVANWSRHSSPAQLYKSYVTNLVSKADAQRFFGIVPGG
jgi:integrase